LRDRTLRVVVPVIEPPYVNYLNLSIEARRAAGYGPGVVMEILADIGEQLNLTYVFFESNDTEWGSCCTNGTNNWTGAFGYLVRNVSEYRLL
jgi:hypothetical protein